MSKYKVGQKVFLTSRLAPQLNGVHIVGSVNEYAEDGQAMNERTGQTFKGFCYRLQGVPGEWAESALSSIS